jgi:hypothetical protein
VTRKPVKTLIAVALLAGTLTACSDDADVASDNLSKAADNFEIQRRIVFYNGITEQYILEVTGLCSIGQSENANDVTITCKIGPDEYVKHFLGLSDNVTYFAEQIESADVSVDHYRVTFKPQTIVPDIDLRGGTEDLPEGQDG